MKLLVRKSGYLVLFAIAAYATATFRSSSGIPALQKKQHDITVLQEQNATLAAENQRKAERIEKLKHDREAQALEIRKRLKLLHPGETQFILPDQKPADKEKP